MGGIKLLDFKVWVVVARAVTQFLAIELESEEDNLEKLDDITALLPPDSKIVRLAVAILCQIRNIPWCWDHLFPKVDS